MTNLKFQQINGGTTTTPAATDIFPYVSNPAGTPLDRQTTFNNVKILFNGDPNWSIQTTWVIDPISGNDNNTGIDNANALKTWTELRRRMLLVGGPSVNGTTITITSSLPSNDPLVTFDCKTSDVFITVIGTTTVVRSGSLTSAPTNRNPATNAANIITDSTVSSWTADIGVSSGRILKMTNGPAQNYYAWVVKNLGSNQARMSTFFLVDDFSEQFPVNGNTYQVLSLPFVPNYCIANTIGNFTFKFLNFGDINSTQYSIGPGSATFGVQFSYCAISYIVNENTNIFVNNCALKNCPNLYTGTIQAYGGVIGDVDGYGAGELETAGQFYLDNGSLFQGVGILCANFGYLRVHDGMFFDTTINSAINVGHEGFARLDKFSGSGHLGNALNVSNTGFVDADLSQMTATGVSGDVFFCGNVISWSSILSTNGILAPKGLGGIIYHGASEYPAANNISLLNVITGVNLKSTGQTTLHTVISSSPAGKKLYITDILLIPTNANTVTVAPVVRVGKTAAFNQWAPLTTLTGLNANDQIFSLATAANGVIRSAFSPGDVVKIDVQTAATATNLTVTVHVLGYYI